MACIFWDSELADRVPAAEMEREIAEERAES